MRKSLTKTNFWFICTKPLLGDGPTRRFLPVVTSMQHRLVETAFVGLILNQKPLQWMKYHFYPQLGLIPSPTSTKCFKLYELSAACCEPLARHSDPILMIAEQQPQSWPLLPRHSSASKVQTEKMPFHTELFSLWNCTSREVLFFLVFSANEKASLDLLMGGELVTAELIVMMLEVRIQVCCFCWGL